MVRERLRMSRTLLMTDPETQRAETSGFRSWRRIERALREDALSPGEEA